MKKIKFAFTFVELIVVITIIAILSTIGFTVFQRYIDISRDTNRVVQLSEIEDGLELLSTSARLPLPENMVSLEVGAGASIDTFAFQGYAAETVMKSIGYNAGGKDPEYGVYPTYMLSKNRKDFQLLTFIQDSKYLSSHLTPQIHADINYTGLFPKVAGRDLGILIDTETQAPIQELSFISSVGTYNILSGTGVFQAYFSDKNIIEGGTGALIEIIPNFNCNRILKLGKSNGNGMYLINPTGTGALQVYCDMTTDGGGWTHIGYASSSTQTSQMSFGSSIGTYSVTQNQGINPYFIDASLLKHTEMMFLIGSSNPLTADRENKLLITKYEQGANGFNTQNLMSCTNFFGGADGLFYKTHLDGDFQWTSVGGCSGVAWYLRPQDYNTPFSGQYLLYFRDTGGSPTSYGTRWGPNAWGEAGSSAFGYPVWFYVR